MSRLVSWPMYAVDPGAVDRFWQRLRAALRDSGLEGVPDALSHPESLLAHWRDPSLLLSQTCGYPLVTSLRGAVRYVATPCFDAPGFVDGFYRSAIVVRQNEAAETIAALAGRTAAFNSRDSQSGYNAFRLLVAPHARQGRFFGRTIETGAHLASLAAVAGGAADVAAVDCVTLALVRAKAPETLATLRILCTTEAAPGLPLVTAMATSDDDVRRLRATVSAACNAARDDGGLLLTGATCLPSQVYASLLAMRDRAVAMGYPEIA